MGRRLLVLEQPFDLAKKTAPVTLALVSAESESSRPPGRWRWRLLSVSSKGSRGLLLPIATGALLRRLLLLLLLLSPLLLLPPLVLLRILRGRESIARLNEFGFEA
jgi:hypothetical protein